MNVSHRILTALLLIFVSISLGKGVWDIVDESTTGETSTNDSKSIDSDAAVLAIYFHGNHRCTTCRDIEANSRSALLDAIERGTVALRVVNYDLPENRNLRQQYDIQFPSLILVQQTGTTSTWKNLSDVWLHSDQPSQFHEYVHSELNAILEKTP